MPTVTRLRRALARPLPSTSRNSRSLKRLCNGGAPPPPPPPPPPPEEPPPSLSPPVNGGAGTGCSITTGGPGGGVFALSPEDGLTGCCSAILVCAGGAPSAANVIRGSSTGADDASCIVRSGIILAVLGVPS